MLEKECGPILKSAFGDMYIINLSSRSDRRADVSSQFQRIGLKIGEDGTNFFNAFSFDRAEGFSSNGTRGCFNSHLGVLRKADKIGNCFIIFEDDINFSKKIHIILPEIMNSIYKIPWSIFYGGVLDPFKIITRKPLEIIDPSVSLMGGHFIAFKPEVISPLIEYLEAMLTRDPGDPQGGPMHVDGAYSWFRKHHPEFMTVVANPVLGYQRASRTDIHELALYDKSPLLRAGSGMIRKLKNLLS